MGVNVDALLKDMYLPYIERENLVRDQITRYSYKPGWEMTFNPGYYPGDGKVMLIFETEDTYHPGHLCKVGKAVPMRMIPDMTDDDEFGRWLANELVTMEIHEQREWLRRDGKLFDNPHAPNATGVGASPLPEPQP